MTSWRRQPWLHFLLLGGLLFGAERWLAPPQAEAIAVDATQVQALREEWRRETGRWPSAAQLQASLARQVDEERLLREALRLQLDIRDPVARERLLANLRFALADSTASDEALLEQARQLNLPARDLVVRRRLVQAMEHRLLEPQLPPEQALRQYVETRPARYAKAARYRLEQRYFSGPKAQATALAALQAQPEAPQSHEHFLLGERFESLDATEITARFGPAFTQAALAATPGTWSGPLLSPYGAHLVRVQTVQPGQDADYAAVRTQAAYAWLAEHEPQRLRAALSALRARYPASLAPELLAQGLRA